jgi:rare lipoprotein A
MEPTLLRAIHLTPCLGIALCIGLVPAVSDARSSPHHVSLASLQEQTGVASFYGDELQGHRTASGRRFDYRRYTAASLTLPINSRAQVTSLKTGLSVTVTITDRGPFTKARVIDLSKAAAEEIGITARDGIGMVSVRPLAAATAKTRDRGLSSL